MKIQPGAIPAKNLQPQPKELQQNRRQFNLAQDVKGSPEKQPLGRSVQLQNPHQLQATKAPDLRLAMANLRNVQQNPTRGPGALRMIMEPLQSRAGDMKLLLHEMGKNPKNKNTIGRLSALHEKMMDELRDLPNRYHNIDPDRRTHLLSVTSREIAKIDQQLQSLFKDMKIDGQGTFDTALPLDQRQEILRGLKNVNGGPEQLSPEFQEAFLKGDVKISEDGQALGFSMNKNDQIFSVFVKRDDDKRFSLTETESIPLMPAESEVI